MADKIRSDIALVEQGLCPSRERAQRAIMEGLVFLNDKRINKPSDPVNREDMLTLKSKDTEYVSRGALKLEKAVRVFHADLADHVIMDIGSSTGGFTDVCLRNNARLVYSIDVGYGQLDWKLRNDERVIVMERTNARYLTRDLFKDLPEITVMDVSFISIRLIIPAAISIMGDNGIFYTLIKPQFEAGRDQVGKKGVIRDPEIHKAVLNDIVAFVDSLGWAVVSMDYSPITGPKGNIEFLAEIRKNDRSRPSVSPDKINDIVSEAHQMTAS